MRPALIIEGCDFESYPPGGQLTFVRNVFQVFPERFGLVGLTTDAHPVGSWRKKTIAGVEVDFFAAGRRQFTANRPLIPHRLQFFHDLTKYENQILDYGARHVLVVAPEVLLAIVDWGFDSICYKFSGLENPLTASRYLWARHLAGLFQRCYYEAARRATVLLAAADQDTIDRVLQNSDGQFQAGRINHFPTAVDLQIFHQLPKQDARRTLGLPSDGVVLVSTGRISKAKGWRLLLDSFHLFAARHRNARLIFVGDGEDRQLLVDQVRAAGLMEKVSVTGFEPPRIVALYLNASDVFVLASEREGWSTSLLEALACGKSAVCTDVSSARELVRDGMNGFIVKSRDPEALCSALESALELEEAAGVSTEIARAYSLEVFRERLRALWKPLL